MLTRAQIETYVKEIPEAIDPEDLRAAYATITGFAEDKSIKEIQSYYSLSSEKVDQWMNYFKFNTVRSENVGKRSSKTKKIENYLKENTGKIVTPKQVAEDVGMSLPTFYNFYNANMGYFKKVKRGSFEILDPRQERAKNNVR
jgi:hypothetical protein